eukprot:CAMPEP_0198143998 /NCGR_PEP_ID=MMETSP1443-20131203/12352_1 /TAXON_ID=186043 /ORGANISM="Entomoneis sp., Strain CCMP2396" /LENGTH=212 /DNA_ID=CAMNT_0043807315 /DNA_START=55 /DNA_END=690 /DNA_ORIENTATION=-
MKCYVAALPFTVIASWSISSMNAFTGPQAQQTPSAFQSASLCKTNQIWALSSSDNNNEDNDLNPQQEEESGPPAKKNLVDQATFIAAIDTLLLEVAKANGADDTSAESNTNAGKELAYAIGKLTVNLPINEQPEFDLTESTGLVLVSAVSEKTRTELGMQPLDTIVGVSAGTFQENTKASTLEHTAATLQAAVLHAHDNGLPEVELEMNRLI